MKFFLYFLGLCTIIGTHIYVIKKNPSKNIIPTYTNARAENGGSPQSIFRGDSFRQGHAFGNLSKNPEVKWQSEQLNFKIHSASKATPAVDSSGIYVATDSGWLLAYDLETRKLRWKWFFPDASSGLHSTPATDEKFIYFGTYRGKFYCLSKKDGQLQWVTQLADAVGSSPTISGDSIYVGAEFDRRQGYLAKIDRETGHVKWMSPFFGDQTHSTPAVDDEDHRVFIGDNAGYMNAFDTDNGLPIWRSKIGAEIKGSITLVNHNIYFGSWAKKFHALSGETGEVIWESILDGKSQSSASYSENEQLFYLLSQEENRLYAIDLQTGKQKWKNKLKKSRAGMSSPLLLHGSKELLIAACAKKTVCLYEPSSGKSLAKIKIPQTLTGSFSYFKESLYLNLEDSGIIELK